MVNTGILTCLKLYIQMVKGGKHGETQEDTIFETPGTYRTRQPRISVPMSTYEI